MIKILASSDIHNDRHLISEIVKKYFEEKPDYIILLGDISEFGYINTKILDYLSKKINPKKIIIIPGNHDIKEVIYELSKKFGFIDLDKKYMIVKDNFILIGIGGGDILYNIVTEEEIKEFFENIEEKIKGKDIILLSHLPPSYSSLSLNISGSEEISRFILEKNPILHIHGHIHETGGLDDLLGKTKILNVARTTKIIEIKDNKEIEIM